MLLSASLGRLFSELEQTNFNFIMSQIFQGAIWAGVATLFINNLLRLWSSFRRDIYGDRGYLLDALPVNTRALFWSRHLTSLIILLLNLLVCSSTILLAYGDAISSFRSAVHEIFLLIGLLALEIFSLYTVGIFGIIVENKNLHKSRHLGRVAISALAYLVSQVLIFVAFPLASLVRPDLWAVLSAPQSLMDFELLRVIIYFCISVQILIILGFSLLSAKNMKKSINLK